MDCYFDITDDKILQIFTVWIKDRYNSSPRQIIADAVSLMIMEIKH